MFMKTVKLALHVHMYKNENQRTNLRFSL